MVNVSDDLKSAFLTGRQKNLTLNFYKNNVLVDTLTPDAIVMESMEIQQLLCSESQLTFGLCNAAEFRVEIFNGSVSHNGLIVKPVISTHDDEDVEYTFDLGIYKVVEDAVSDDRNTRTLTAYDALYDVVNNEYSEWYKSLTFPMTLKQFRDAFFSHIGITQATINLPNDGMEIQKTIETNNLSGSAILKAILEINASFGFIDYTGTFRYTLWTEGTGLFPAEDLYPSPDLYPVGVAGESIGGTAESAVVLDTLVYADYVVREITGVLIQTTSTDEGTLVGTNANVYPILANFLLYDKSSSDLQTIGHNFLRYADQLYYRPSRFQVRCHPWVELGDFLSVNASSFRVTLPVLQRTITGITALYDEFEAQGSEIYTTQANNLTMMTENLYRKSLEIIKSVDLFKVEMHDELYGQNGVYSVIQQTASNIVLKVDSNGNIVEVALGISADDPTATTFSVKAANISMRADEAIDFLTNGNINLTSKNITISSDNFSVDANGTIYATHGNFSGDISASSITGSTFQTSGTGGYSGRKLTLTGGEIQFGSSNKARINNFDNAVEDGIHIHADNLVDISTGYGANNWIHLDTSTVTLRNNATINVGGGSASIKLNGSNVATTSQIWSSLSVNPNYKGNTGEYVKMHNYDADDGSTVLITFTALWNAVSDRRVKTDIVDLDSCYVDIYEKLKPVIIAQDVEEAFDDVGAEKNGVVSANEKSDRLNLHYDSFHALHVKYAHHLKERIDELEQKNAELEERLSRLEALIGRE